MKLFRERNYRKILAAEFQRGYNAGVRQGKFQAENEYTLDMRNIDQARRHHMQVIRLEGHILKLEEHNQQLQDELDEVTGGEGR